MAQWLLEMPFCAEVNRASTRRYAGFPCLHSCIASNKYFSLLALRVKMAFQRFPALVVVFIKAFGGLEAPLGDGKAEG